jgi:hypothetical protein
MLHRTSNFMRDLYEVENSHGGKNEAKHKLFQQASSAIDAMASTCTLTSKITVSAGAACNLHRVSGHTYKTASP